LLAGEAPVAEGWHRVRRRTQLVRHRSEAVPRGKRDPRELNAQPASTY